MYDWNIKALHDTVVTHLHRCAIGDSLVGVDGLAELLAVEEVLEHLLHLGDTGGAANQDDLVHLQEPTHVRQLAQAV
jgi:hypothetical protein